MTTVRQILNEKGPQVWTIEPTTMVFQSLQLMAEKNIGALLIIEGEHVVGIFSERDYARKVDLQGRSTKSTPVQEVMTRNVICVHMENSVEECMALMTEKHIRHLPVVENDNLVGIISIGDVVKSIISEQEILIDHLVNYITGR